jgi:alanine dehydrogenase
MSDIMLQNLKILRKETIMRVGVPKEIKNHEYRVGLTPGSVAEVIRHGHEVMVEKDAGMGIGITNADYEKVGAIIVDKPEVIFEQAQMIIKVKEPQPNECKMLRPDQVLFTYLHLAPDPEQTQLLQESGCIAIAYETVEDALGGLPLLSPMSEVAGRLSVQAGAHCLEKAQGGRGVLLGGVPGVSAADVLVLGGGVVGINAIHMAVGMGARVTVLDKSLVRLRELDHKYGSKLNTIYSTQNAVEDYIQRADLVVGAVLLPGAAAPKLIQRDMLKTMRRGAVIVDVAIDQGGCCETSRATTHDDPTYVIDNVVHYCVANMPGNAARTSTFALNNATLPYILRLVNQGYEKALLGDTCFMKGLNICKGHVTCEAVAQALDLTFTDPVSLM